MGDTFTSKRNIPYKFPTSYYKRQIASGVSTLGPINLFGSSGAYITSLLNSYRSTQTTTSYRSRGAESDERTYEGVFAEFAKLTSERKAILAELNGEVTPGSLKRGNTRGPLVDRGHPFSTIKRTLWISHENFYVSGAHGTFYHGPLYPSFRPGQPSWLSSGVQNNPALLTSYYGPLAIKLTTPTQPAASTANMVGELLRDGRPDGILANSFKKVDQLAQGYFGSLRYVISSSAQAGAKDFLNFSFAIQPLLKDLEKVFHAVINSEKILNQIRRDSGRNVRRRMQFPPTVETSEIFREAFVPYGLNDFGNGSNANKSLFLGYNPSLSPSNNADPAGARGLILINRSQGSRYWFSGAYTYYFPDGDEDSLMDNVSQWVRDSNKILGYGVTPETLWNLTPWTWLSDWFVNIGDNITNYTNFSQDNLVLRYGYLMRHMTTQYTHTAQNIVFYNGYNPGTVTARYSVESKDRVKATPFGFGSNPNTWSARQWAILASLGMTRSPRVAY